MSSTKKEDEKDELSASINKSMTIDKLKDSLRSANVFFLGSKKKADLVSLYISKGLHKKDNEPHSVTPEVKSPSNSPEVKEKPVKAIEPKEELIMSIIISAHGEESYDWPPTMPIAQYYRNNVRVYSRGCVPGVVTLQNPRYDRQSIDDAYNIFEVKPESATEEIMAQYTGLDKEYYTDFLDNLNICNPTNEYKDMIKDVVENKDRCGGLSTYLSQKKFSFAEGADKASKYKSEAHFREFIASRGLNVSDIRLKITDTDGSVRYRRIFNPIREYDKYLDLTTDVSLNRFDITQFNLIYRHGIEFILKVLHKEEMIVPALKILGFKEGEYKLSEINLEQLYRFFELVGIKYVNIIDHSCRYFHWSWKMSKPKREKLFKKEQQYSVKPVAFGKRSDSKKQIKSLKRKKRFTRRK
jgi:hypothetical protein